MLVGGNALTQHVAGDGLTIEAVGCGSVGVGRGGGHAKRERDAVLRGLLCGYSGAQEGVLSLPSDQQRAVCRVRSAGCDMWLASATKPKAALTVRHCHIVRFAAASAVCSRFVGRGLVLCPVDNLPPVW